MPWSELLRDVSLVIASWSAVYGIGAWRGEFRGRRQIELAEEVLALFYQARDVITAIRSPLSYGGEGTTRQPSGEETELQKRARDQAYVVFERYKTNEELFARIHSLRYRFATVFGEPEAEPFKDLDKAVRSLFVSARMLAQLWGKDSRSIERLEEHYPDRAGKWEQDIRKHEEVIWWAGENDPIADQVESAVRQMETSCRSVIEAKGTVSWFTSLVAIGWFKRFCPRREGKKGSN